MPRIKRVSSLFSIQFWRYETKQREMRCKMCQKLYFCGGYSTPIHSHTPTLVDIPLSVPILRNLSAIRNSVHRMNPIGIYYLFGLKINLFIKYFLYFQLSFIFISCSAIMLGEDCPDECLGPYLYMNLSLPWTPLPMLMQTHDDLWSFRCYYTHNTWDSQIHPYFFFNRLDRPVCYPRTRTLTNHLPRIF